jgi:isopentenyldiphosphate isomerase
MMDEYLDLVNIQDEIIGKKLRSAVYAEGLSNFRVVNAFLVNQQGQLWIPRRSLNKRLFPGGFDMSMGGHVESGETYEQAFKRELAEELNIKADEIFWKLLGFLTPQDGVSAFMKVYEISVNTTPQYNRNDFTESFWFTPVELIKRIEAGESSKSDLPILVRKFYAL